MRLARFCHAISLFGFRVWHFPVPARFREAAARSRGPGRRAAAARGRALLDGGEPGGSLPKAGGRSVAAALSLVLVVSLSGLGPPVQAAPDDGRMAAAVTEASGRFHLPEVWIRAVIAAESGGRPDAVSRAGAMGLMQLMPGTWREARSTLGLGSDPFDVRDNILAGSAYLRRMLDLYGEAGFLAAYNAGPARYEAWLSGARPLPAETRAYVAGLARRLNRSLSLPDRTGEADWRRSGLFHVRRPRSEGDEGAEAGQGAADSLFGASAPRENAP